MHNAAFTAAACRIARIDRQKFNDVMASGEYDCAPKAQAGYPRVFELKDLIALFLFARLNERGRTVKQAARVACQAESQMRNAVNNGNDIPMHLAVAYGMNGASFVATGDDTKPDASHIAGVGAILWTEMWHLHNLRDEVKKGLAEEGRIAGGADEE